MQKPIANIVTDTLKTRFDIKVNKCKSLEEIDKSLPTLIIGLGNAKKYINNFNILKKEYKEQKIWWTFLRTERMTDYQEDLQSFYETAIKYAVESIDYEYVDILDCGYKRSKNILKYLFASNDEKIGYIDNNGSFLFIYSRKYKKIWGFSLSTMKFYGINESSINKTIKNIRNIDIINDFSTIPYKVRRIVGDKIHHNIILYGYF